MHLLDEVPVDARGLLTEQPDAVDVGAVLRDRLGRRLRHRQQLQVAPFPLQYDLDVNSDREAGVPFFALITASMAPRTSRIIC